MILKKSTYWIVLLLISSFISVGYYNQLSTSDVTAALKLFNIEFSKKNTKTLLPYIKRNQKGYANMRTFALNQNTQPAFSFNLPIKNNQYINLQFEEDSSSMIKDEKEIAFFPISKLAYLIKNKLISSEKLTKIYLNRIKKYNKDLNVIVTLTENIAIKQAKKADLELNNGLYRGLLHGIPYGIKDLASFPGYPTTWGAEPYKNQLINEKAEVIQILEESGAVMLGKLSSGALARGDVWFGGKTKNPWDLNQGSSGSSAGSASATAAGLVGFSIGTETLGSIISPSTRCGVSGLRPTYGSVSTNGFMTLSWSMDKIGPIARTAKGCAIVFNEIQKKEGLNKINKPFNKNVNNLKIAFLEGLFLNDTSRYAKNNTKTLAFIKKKTPVLHPTSLPKNFPFDVFDIILRAEAGAFFDEFLLTKKDETMVEQNEKSRANSLRQSRLIPAVEYIQANRFRTKLIEETNKIFNNYDIIISPSFGKNQLLITNLTGHPAISIPNGLDENNKPTSITFIANYYQEDVLLSFVDLIQKETNHHLNKPPLFY
jgi:Asp-tRNA(Asn)/Glu-tRNA(Gln) amidotransferase A subunit family amidase